MKQKNITIGQTVNDLTIVGISGRNNRGETMFNCLCRCGRAKLVKYHWLTTGKARSCGCRKTGPKVADLVGQRFSQLIVLSLHGKDRHRCSIWLCRCDCGQTTLVRRAALISGHTQSCGQHPKIGVEHHCYNPNITAEQRADDRGLCLGYKRWARLVKKRFDYTCFICLAKKQLVAHHLNSFHHFRAERLDVSNGICLCSSCHNKFHRKYPKSIATWELFVDYLETL